MVPWLEELDRWYSNTTSSAAICSHGAEKRLLASSGDWYTGCKVKWLNGLPMLPKPPQSYVEHLPRLYMVTHRHGRLKTNAETISNVRTRRDRYHAKGAPMQPLHPLTTPSGMPYWKAWPHDCEKKRSMPLLADSDGQHTEREEKRPNDVSVPLEPPRTSIMHVGRTFTVAHQGEGVKTSAESVSNAQTRQNAYCVQAALMQPPLPLFEPSRRSIGPARGLWTMKIGYNEIGQARQVETRVVTHPDGHTHGIPTIAPPAPSPEHTRHLPRPYWVSRRRGRLKTSAEIVSNLRRRRSAHRAHAAPMRPCQPLPMPSGPLEIIAGGSPTLGVRYNEASVTRIIQTEGNTYPGDHTHGILTISTSFGPRKRRKPPWNIAGTYQRQGVPHPSIWGDDEPLYGQNGGLTIMVQGHSARTTVHFRNGKLPQRGAANTNK
ncbi:hypothetical protein EDC04DRAFT_3097551 [Pisolithus marmoratus]|nr:hypothetical protein EDC04DRAFT_3097551 [Pisolithus marmoratus]